MYAGKQLKRLRQELDINQEEFAKAVNVSQSYYSSVEMGKKPITNKILSVIEKKWGVKQDWFTKDYTSLSAYKVGVVNGGNNGGSKVPEDFFDKPAFLRRKIAFEKQLQVYLKKNPDVQKIESAIIELFGAEYILSIVSQKHLNFITEFPDKPNTSFEDALNGYWKHIEALKPYKNAFIHLAEALNRFYKEMYEAGDPYFEFAADY